jgi:hypothetical protein
VEDCVVVWAEDLVGWDVPFPFEAGEGVETVAAGGIRGVIVGLNDK